MRSRSILVAEREFLENIRTKTFWIGILVFPVILSLAIVIPILIEKSKSARRYAVIDHSGWLLEAVEQRAAVPDLKKVFRFALDASRDASEDFEQLPEELQRIAEKIDRDARGEGAEPDPRAEEAVIGKLAGLATLEDAGADRAQLEAMLGQRVVEELIGMEGEEISELVDSLAAIRSWWRELPPEQARKLGSTSKSRYRRVEANPQALAGEALVEDLNQRVAEGELFAYFVLAEDPVHAEETGRYVSSNLTDDSLKGWFSRLASDEIRSRRLAEKNISPEDAKWVQKPIALLDRRIAEGGAEEEVEAQDLLRQWAPVAFVYLLWIAVFTISQMLLTNTVEEKSNRILEVLLSSVSPVELMIGKIGGIAATGLTMIGTWVAFLFFAVTSIPRLMGAELDVDLGRIATDPVYIGSFVVYFVLGYLFFATLFVGIGSVCNSLKEAQNLQTPVILVLMVPLFAMVPVAQDPNGTLAKILSYIPPFTPFVMMNRAAGPPTVFEYAVTTVLLAGAIVFVLWATAKVFRIGILMTGKPPSLIEIAKWVRAPVGLVPVREE